MIGNFSEESQSILLGAKLEMYDLGHPYIGTEHLLLSILKNNNNVSSITKEYNLGYDNFKSELCKVVGESKKKSEFFLYTPLLRKVIDSSIVNSREYNNNIVTPELLFYSILEEGEGIAIRIMLGMGINLDLLYDEFSFSLFKNSNNHNRKKKLFISEIGVDLTELARNNKIDPVVGRSKEINRVMEILCRRNKNNPILLGEAGVGKTAIVEELARLIAEENVPNKLLNKRIFSLDMASIVAGTKYRGEFEDRMKKIIKEVEENDDIILFIDEIHTLVGAGGAEGAIDASNILKPALARGKIKCIGATTMKEYKKFIEKDAALERRFQKVIVKEPSIDETKNILLGLKPIYEKYHNVIINDNIIKEIISLSERYIFDRYRPDKEIDILDEVCSMVSMKDSDDVNRIKDINKKIKYLQKEKNSFIIENNLDKAFSIRKKETHLLSLLNEIECSNNNIKNIVTKNDVSYVVNNHIGFDYFNDSCVDFYSIKKVLKKNIFGQDNVIDNFINSLNRFNHKMSNGCYSSFFVGPTGVGKTELAKIFASLYTTEENFIRMDMSEYSDSSSVNKILGSSPGFVGYDDNNCVFETIRNKSRCVLLLDEIDKAHPAVINLFYQIMDDGFIRMSNGNIVKFNDLIILMTSNIGFENNKIGFNNINASNAISNLNGYFSSAFINRVDDVFVFDLLSEDIVKNIIIYNFDLLKKKYSLIDFKYSDNVVNDIISLSMYNEFGVRKIKKIIYDYIECYILDCIDNNVYNINISELNNKKIISH